MVIKLKSVLFPCFKAMLFCECSLLPCSLGLDENGHSALAQIIVWLKPKQLITILNSYLFW